MNLMTKLMVVLAQAVLCTRHGKLPDVRGGIQIHMMMRLMRMQKTQKTVKPEHCICKQRSLGNGPGVARKGAWAVA